MKIVVDACLSPNWAEWLGSAGHDAVHWRTIGAVSAPDGVVLAWAAAHGHVLLSNDLDFGAILAASGDTVPSVIQVRTQDVLPEAIGPRVASALRQFEAELTAGALVSIDDRTNRVRVLPIR